MGPEGILYEKSALNSILLLNFQCFDILPTMAERQSPENLNPISFPIEHRETEPISNIAISLPGQDINNPGLFNDIVKHPSGREVIIRANDILGPEFGFRISRSADENPDGPDFKLTERVQPRVYVASIATHNVNKYERGKQGYRTLPHFVTGNSMGIITAATLAGSLSFEEGLRLISTRGKIMQEHGSAIATKMVATINANEMQITELLDRYKDLDLCLINSDTGFVIGGPVDVVDEASSALKEKRVKTLPVNADRAMHSRYVKDAQGPFDRYLETVPFKTPIVPLVGTMTGQPLRNPDEIREELSYGFSNTFDNRKILRFFDDAGIHVFSEINEKGIFAKALERTAGAIAAHKTEAGAILGASLAAGFGIYEVITRHHPNNNGENH